MPNDSEEIVLEKPTQIAFLSLKGLHVTPFTQPNGRVAFKVKGNISKTLEMLNENPAVPILDYIQRLETIRSIIFSMKKDV